MLETVRSRCGSVQKKCMDAFIPLKTDFCTPNKIFKPAAGGWHDDTIGICYLLIVAKQAELFICRKVSQFFEVPFS